MIFNWNRSELLIKTNVAKVAYFRFSSYGKVRAYDCETFTVTLCASEQYEIEANLPPIPLSEQQCQEFCELEADCTRYKYTNNRTSGELICQFFTADYSQECGSFGGTLVRYCKILYFLSRNYITANVALYLTSTCLVSLI